MADKKTAGIGKGTPGPGRGKGTPNKTTVAAREAIAAFVDGNAHRLTGWLDAVAGGVPKLNADGEPIPGEFLVKPDPAKAYEMFQSVIEYHVPKLQRTEHTGEGGGPVRIVASEQDEEI